MFGKITLRKNREERQKRRLGGRFSVFFAVLQRSVCVIVFAWLIASIVLWGSMTAIEVIKTDRNGLTLSGDGYYEIRTAEEYREFWEIVGEKDVYARGRLLEDIYLNDTTDFGKWKQKEPVNECRKVDSFYGSFDGGGHTIYGLYSNRGYGLVKENRGQILNLTIKDSLIVNEIFDQSFGTVGGICGENYRLVRPCDFGGEIYGERMADRGREIGGICGKNRNTVELCGFSGKMVIKGWTDSSVGGICGENQGEIITCYNLTSLQSMPWQADRFYAIADQGETNCLWLKDSGWIQAHNGQAIGDEEEEKERVKERISGLLNKDLYELLVQKEGPEEWMRENSVKSPFPVTEIGLEDPFPNILDDILHKQQEREQILRDLLAREELASLIWEAVWCGTGEGGILEMETEVSDELVSLVLSNRKDSVKINIRPAAGEQSLNQWTVIDGRKWREFKTLWQQCGSILRESGIDDYERFSWHMTDTLERERETLGKFILYRTDNGKQGFFWQKGETLYQIEGSVRGDQDFETKIKKLSVTEEQEEVQEDCWEKPSGGLYETMLWKVWDGRMPARGVGWDSSYIRDAVCQMFPEKEGTPSWEEIGQTEYLVVMAGNRQIGTLMDLEKIPHIKALHLSGAGATKINFDLTKEMVRELEELQVGYVELESLAFLEQFPQLKKLYVMNCGLKDLSGIECQKELRDLSFYSNEIKEIGPLTNCRKLERLSLAFNKIEDLSALSHLSDLSEVGVQGNRISDLAPLQHLSKLKALNINGNLVTDLSPLKGQVGLTALGAGYNKIKDISPLEGMTQLSNLALDNNEIQDIGVIGNMTQLQYLGISHNRIEDFSPVMGLTNLLFFSMGKNPGQDIGNLIFVPKLNLESRFQEDDKMVQKAQGTLDQFYPDEKIAAEDMATGDLNGDGVTDLAITGLSSMEEEGYQDDGRKIYLFLGQIDGSFRPLTPIVTLDPYAGGVYGDPYDGILISDGRLVVKAYGGSNWRWGFTNIYEYEKGEMEEKWVLDLSEHVFYPGYDFTITDKENGTCRSYAVAGEWEREGRMLLLSQTGPEPSLVETEFEQKYSEYQEKAEIVLPEFSYMCKPSICENSYDYRIHDTLYDTKVQPEDVLFMAAERYLYEYQELPVPYYTSEEIRQNYETLTGVKLPEFFLIGRGINEGDGIKVIAYSNCQQLEDGSWQHILSQWTALEDYWSFECRISYDEREDHWSYERLISYDERDGMFMAG